MENGPFEDIFPIEHGDISLLLRQVVSSLPTIQFSVRTGCWFQGRYLLPNVVSPIKDKK